MRLQFFVVVVISPMVASASSFTQIVSPIPQVCGNSISSNGIVAGQDQYTALVYVNGTISQPPHLKSQTSSFLGVNREGDVVARNYRVDQDGRVVTSTYVNRHGINYSVPLTDPAIQTNLLSITDGGTVLGTASIKNEPSQGFLWYQSGKIDYLPTSMTYVSAISSRGDWVLGICGTSACTYHLGTLTPISVPGATLNLQTIDDEGRVSGEIYQGGTTNGIYRLQGQNYTVWVAPGATQTWIYGANDAGQITGCYTDKHNQMHGYIAIP